MHARGPRRYSPTPDSSKMSEPTLPPTHRALVLTSTTQPLEVREMPMYTPSLGSAIIRVTAASIITYAREVLTGVRKYDYPKPYVPGSAAVGHIVALGSDATILRVGDLVLSEIWLHARDDPNQRCLQGVSQGGLDGAPVTRLVQDEDGWRHGSWAQYVKVPLENCYRVPDVIGAGVGTLRAEPVHWLHLAQMVIPFGGLTGDGGVDLRTGESIVIAPATGAFGGSAVEVALAMGARVVALGRSEEGLRRLEDGLREYVNAGRLRTVRMSEYADAESLTTAIGPVDCYLDISPHMAAQSFHFKACLLALGVRGRACLMGGIFEDIAMPHRAIVRNDLRITGKWMYERKAVFDMIKMAKAGVLDLTRGESWSFGLEDWDAALIHAEEHARWGQITFFEP
ncbi:GroES-like protein [Cubamyces sp. BRFM 1775]|nr:GroES-like protein [Cubamyces sp. BRFM 1775]